ncbi:MAG: hypothetical protein RR497_06585, partial [Oscillospiraceae bacterium]
LTILSQSTATIKRSKGLKDKHDWDNIQNGKTNSYDKVNPQKQAFFREAVAEENIIVYLFKNPDICNQLLEKISPDDFSTDFNKRVLQKLIGIIKSGEDITLSNLYEGFSIDEISVISRSFAQKHEFSNTKELLDDYIDILLQHKNELSNEDIKSMSGQDLELIRQQLLQKKKK